MPKMSFARGAAHFGPDHTVRYIPMFLDNFRIGRCGKARPTRPAVEFRIRNKQGRAAACAAKFAGTLLIGQFSGKGALGPGLAQDMILHRVQFGPPFRIALVNFFHFSAFQTMEMVGCAPFFKTVV